LPPLRAPDLSPRAYAITPVHSNAIILTWSFYDGSIEFDGTVQITGATGTYNISIFSYYHDFSFFGRSANVTIIPRRIAQPSPAIAAEQLRQSKRFSRTGWQLCQLPEFHGVHTFGRSARPREVDHHEPSPPRLIDIISAG
jgi:hypothetical protein